MSLSGFTPKSLMRAQFSKPPPWLHSSPQDVYVRCEVLCPVAPAGDLKMFSTGCKKSRFNCFECDGQKACSIIFRVINFYGPPCSFLWSPPDGYTKQIQVDFKICSIWLVRLLSGLLLWFVVSGGFLPPFIANPIISTKARVLFKLGGQKGFCVSGTTEE